MSKFPDPSPLRLENDIPRPLQPTPLPVAASQDPPQKTSSTGKEASSTKAFGFPLRFLLREQEDPILPPPTGELHEGPAANSPHRYLKENSFDSPLRSPVRQSGEQTLARIPQTIKETPFPILPLRSPLLEADNTIPHASQQPVSTQNENAPKSPGRDGAIVVMDLQSVLEEPGSPMLHPERSSDKPTLANRMAAPVATMAAKVGGAGVKGMRVESGVLRWAAMRRAEFGLRVVEVVLCMVSFSVMAADKTTGWAGDSFDRYQEFRYCISMNVIAFVYSGFQVYAQFHHSMKKRRIIDRPLSYYLDFSFDQTLAYLLMSASSSAASRNDGWISMFGRDKFTEMINGSIAMSFLAFLAFALSSIISADKLFSWAP